MSNGLRPYQEYKDSGVPWLGHVPVHWEMRRLGAILQQRNERNSPIQTSQVLSLSIAQGVTLYSHEGRGGNRAKDDLTAYKIARAGDIVLNSMNVVVGAVGLSRYTGAISPVYYALHTRSNDVDINYYVNIFGNPVFQRHLLVYGRGILIKEGDSGKLNTIRMKISPQDLKTVTLPVPPMEEQSCIANYLTHSFVQINRFIRNRRRLIELLSEQKEAIIYQSVTRGVDDSVSLKPSGIDWLKDIPAHWHTGRIKTELQNLNTKRVPLSAIERGAMTERAYDYYGASGVIDKVEDYLFDDELLLIAEDGANLVLRNLPLAIVARGKFWVNNHAHILKPRRGELEYFAALLEGIDYLPWISGAAQPKLTQDRLMAIRIPVPPSEEQVQIVRSFKERTSGLAAAIEKAEREITLIREYRTRLIADVVTGKVDVRGLAPSSDGVADDQLHESLEDYVSDRDDDNGNVEFVEEMLVDD